MSDNVTEEVSLKSENYQNDLVEYRWIEYDYRGLKLFKPYLGVRINKSVWWPVQLIMNEGHRQGLNVGDSL